MYKEQKHFILPEEHQIVWKYMDFTKFLSLLSNESLFFCRVNRLGDQFEGIIPDATINAWKKRIEKNPSIGSLERLDQLINYIHHRLRPNTFVNCWITSTSENYAMWKIYSKDKLGVAIQSNVGNLIESLKDVPENIYIGKVTYTEPEFADLRLDNTFFPFLNKVSFYSFENELRLINEEYTPVTDASATGKLLKVDIRKLINKIYISTYAPKEFFRVIDLIVKDYHLNVEICQSKVIDQSLR